MSKLSFLKSRRFWGLIIIAVLGVFQNEGIIAQDIVSAIVLIIGGFIGIRTLDRFSETLKS